jgi:hypothetical protein
MRRYRFSALVTVDPAAHRMAWRDARRTPACYLVEPCCRMYFPALIAPDDELSARPAIRTVVSIALADGEAEAFFAPGQRFTIWADAIIGPAIRAHSRAGSGVISGLVSPPPPRAHDDSADGTAAGPPGVHSLVALDVPAVRGGGQRLAV